MTVPREPDHVHEKRDACTEVVAEDEAEEDGTGDVEEAHPTETEDEGLEHPAEEDGEDDIGDGVAGACGKTQRVEGPPLEATSHDVKQCGDSDAGPKRR